MKLTFNQRPECIKSIFDEVKFNTFSKICVDSVRGTLKSFTVEQANAEILKNMRAIAGLDENSTAYDVKHAMRNSTAIREAIFQVIGETVNDTLVSGWQKDPFFKKYVDYKSMKLGDTNIFYIPENIDIVISEIAASNHDITRQRLGSGSEISVATKNYGAKVYMEAERFLMGVEDWTELINKISKAYTKLINTLLHNAVMGAGSKLPSPGQWNITVQPAYANRKTFIKLLSDVSIATGSKPVIMGTEVALSQLTEFGKVEYMSDSAKEDVYNMGRIGHFDQYEMVEIPQAFDDNDTSTYLVDDTKILIMPGNIDKFVKMYDEGDTQIKEVKSRDVNYDNTFEYEMIRKFGINVLTNTRFGTVTLTA